MSAVSENSELLNINISSNVTALSTQKRYLSSVTVNELKASHWSSTYVWAVRVCEYVCLHDCVQGKLELVTGSSTATMQLQLLDTDQQLVCDMSDDMRTLQSYNVTSGMTIFVSILIWILIMTFDPISWSLYSGGRQEPITDERIVWRHF